MLVAGWILAVAAFFVIGTDTCAAVTTTVPLVGDVRSEVCQDTTSQAIILLVVVGFAATVGSLFLWALRYVLLSLAEIESNTRSGGR